MELILWRHAKAEEAMPDHARKLTSKGIKQAAHIAHWLDLHIPNNCKILVSPTKRTTQTADALGRSYKTHAELAPDTTAEDLLALVKWPENKGTILVVGHQPILGQVASLLLCGVQQDWQIKKGSVWWIAQSETEGVTTNYLKAVITPGFVVK